MKQLAVLIFITFFGSGLIAQENENTPLPAIINSGKPLTNEIIFKDPSLFKKDKKPLYFVNNKEVATIAYYSREEFDSITVLQSKQSLAKFGTRGKNGAVLARLRDDVKTPLLIVTTNRIYYTCEINGRLADTTELYYEQVERNKCFTLDLRDTGTIPTLYLNFENKIKVKNLGAGWDRTTIYVSNGPLARGYAMGEYIVKPTKEGMVKIVIKRGDMKNREITTEYFYNTTALPETKKASH